MQGLSSAWSFVLASAVVFCGESAHAGDSAAARALFEEGRRLVTEGNYEKACPKFEASLQMSPGLGTRFNLAECWDHVGRTASAWAEYLGVAAAAKTAGQSEREKVARERAAAIESRLSRLVIDVKGTDANIEIRRGETPIAKAMWGTAVPTDPGRHVLEARAPGKKTWTSTVEVPKTAGTVRVTVPPLEDAPTAAATPTPQTATANSTATPAPSAPAAPATSSAPPAPAVATSSTTATEPSASTSSSAQRTIGYIVGGVGVVGLGVGTAFGLMTLSKNNEASGICVGRETNCPEIERYNTLSEDAKTYRTITYASLIGGGVALVTGAVLVFTAPSRVGATAGATQWAVAPMLGPGTAGTFVRAAW